MAKKKIIPVMTSMGVKKKVVDDTPTPNPHVMKANPVVEKPSFSSSSPIPELNGSNLASPIETVGNKEKIVKVDKETIVLDNKVSHTELNELLKRDDVIFKFDETHPVVLDVEQQNLLRIDERRAYKIAWDVFNIEKGPNKKRQVKFVDIAGDGATMRLKPTVKIPRGKMHVWADPNLVEQYVIAGYTKTGETLKSTNNRENVNKTELVGMLVDIGLYNAIREGDALKSQNRLSNVNENAESEIGQIAGDYSKNVSIYEKGKLVKD